MSREYTIFGIPFQSKKLYLEAMDSINHWLISEGYYIDEGPDVTISELIILDYCSWFEPDDERLLNFLLHMAKAIRLKTSTYISDDKIIDTITTAILDVVRNDLQKDTHLKVERYYHRTLTRDKAIEKFDVYMDTVYKNDNKVMREVSIDLYLQYIENDISVKIYNKLEKKLQHYKPVGTDEKLSQEEKRKGILNTIHILQQTIQDDLKVKKIEYKPFDITYEKMIYTDKNGRNQKLERLMKLMQEANTNYVLKDDNDNFFYPFIANIFFTHYSTEIILNKNEEIIKALKAIEYESQKLGTNIIDIVDNEVQQSLSFHKKVHKDQIWNYATTVYAHKYNTDYSKMSKLIKFFIYQNPGVYTNSLASPTKELPHPLTELDKFTKNI